MLLIRSTHPIMFPSSYHMFKTPPPHTNPTNGATSNNDEPKTPIVSVSESQILEFSSWKIFRSIKREIIKEKKNPKTYSQFKKILILFNRGSVC